jgi:O-antigen ligase
LWLDLGMAGIALVVASLLRCLRDARTCLRAATPMTEWHIGIIVLTLLSNISEMTIMYPNYLAWIMYMMAAVGLNEQARRIQREEV